MSDNLSAENPFEFGIAEVRQTVLVTPHMRRITLGGKDLHMYPWLPDALGPHIQLLFPQRPGAPIQPEIFADRRAITFSLIARTYTIRRFDRAQHEMDIDFVMHGDGIASTWASKAKAGDQIVLWRREPRRRANHDFYLLLGDLTALPAISQILESLPHEAKGLAVVEVDNISDRQTIDYCADIDLSWVGPSENMPLLRALQAQPWPQNSHPFIWVGTEARQAGAIRAYVRRSLGMRPRDYSVVDYWTQDGPKAHPKSFQRGQLERP